MSILVFVVLGNFYPAAIPQDNVISGETADLPKFLTRGPETVADVGHDLSSHVAFHVAWTRGHSLEMPAIPCVVLRADVT
jgi:hypothetical protein